MFECKQQTINNINASPSESNEDCASQKANKGFRNDLDFDGYVVDPNWAFEDFRSTEQWTHGYHRYPAKFLPNVVQKIIEEHSPTNCKVIADLFAGCGTTLVEAKAHGISSIGTDINPVARLIARVKTTPIAPEALQFAYNNLTACFDEYDEANYANIQKHERLDHWFFPSEKAKIAFVGVPSGPLIISAPGYAVA